MMFTKWMPHHEMISAGNRSSPNSLVLGMCGSWSWINSQQSQATSGGQGRELGQWRTLRHGPRR